MCRKPQALSCGFFCGGGMGATPWVMMAHIVTLGTWSAALLILTGLYGAAPRPGERAQIQRHRVMCRYMFVIIASPAAVLAIVTGCVLVALLGASGSWLLAKLAVVALLAMYHAYCGKLLDAQGMESRQSRPRRRHPFLVVVPVVLICTIFVLVLAKPDVVLEYQLTPQPAGHRDQGGAEQRQMQSAAGHGLQRVFQTG